MLATIRDDTWNVLNMQHITLNSKRWDYSDIPGGCHKKIKGPAHMVKMATTLEKPPPPPTGPQENMRKKILPKNNVTTNQQVLILYDILYTEVWQ